MKELLRWQVGDVRITRVQELEAPDLRFVIPEPFDLRTDTRSRRCTR